MPEFCSACSQPVTLPSGFKMPEGGDTLESVAHSPGGPIAIIAKVRMIYCAPCADKLLVSQWVKRAKHAKVSLDTPKAGAGKVGSG